MINSKIKGKVGELELANFLKVRGFADARRSQQYKGASESADIIDAIPGYHIECKRTEHFRLYPALAQAEQDKAPSDTALVCHRSNRQEWVAVLRLENFLELVKQVKCSS